MLKNKENLSSEDIVELTKAEKKEIKKEVKEILKTQEKENPSETIVKNELTKEEKVSNFFDSIEFLSLDDSQKEEVAKKIKDESAGDKLYWIEIILSSVIAALGLLQNSVAVVIGAMLIAPLLRPINGLSFTIARGGQKFFITALRVLLYSILLSILMGYLITMVVGLKVETTEILARINPNAIDFFIAIFSAVVAVMSIRFSRLGESIAGVAMAASLMPPLAVVGIELAIGNYSASFGAMMLFLANLVAIILVATIFFWLYGFTPHDTRLQAKAFKRSAIVSFLVILILVPLFISFNSIKTDNKTSSEISLYLNNIISEDLEFYEISDIVISNKTEKSIDVKVVLKVPEGYDMTKVLDNIYWTIYKEFGKEINLDLEIIRTFNIKITK